MLIFLILSAFSFALFSGQKAEEKKNTDPMADLCLVEKTQPVQEKVKTGFDSITAKDALAYLKFISSDLLEGRDTASPGYDIAAEYVASMFSLWGIKPAGGFTQPASGGMFAAMQGAKKPTRSYFQNIGFREILGNSGDIRVEWQKGQQKKSRTFLPDMDYTYFASGTQTLTAPVVFVGYGIQEKSLKFDEYKIIDVKGKIVMMLSETPGKDDPDAPFNKGELRKKYNPPRQMRRMTSPKSSLAKKLGAVAILMVENSPNKNSDVAGKVLASRKISDERPIIPGKRRNIALIEGDSLPMPWDTIPTIRISREMTDIILDYVGQDIKTLKGKIEKTLQSHSMPLSSVSLTLTNKAETRLVGSRNVLGYIEGSDPKLKDEVIVIGAHLDHLGKRGDYIFNGADDNGSGSVGVMEVAEAFSKNKTKPKRSILFALWTGEEKGLLGSRYYVSHPFFPLDKTVACLNLDMISRQWDQASLKRMSRMFGMDIPKEMMEKIDIKNFISLSYAAESPELDAILRANNQHVGLSLHLRKSESAMGGSDHAPFALSKLPWVFFFAAMTEDYHQPTDSIEKVSPNFMQKIIRLTYLTAFTLADK